MAATISTPLAAPVIAATGIPEVTRTPIGYPRAIWVGQLRCWISDAEVADVGCTVFTSRKDWAFTARLIVRQVNDLNRKGARGQDELFSVWHYRAVSTGSPVATLQAEDQHRVQTQVEQVFADLADWP